MTKTAPIPILYLVRVPDGYITRDKEGVAYFTVVHTRALAGRFPKKKARSIARIIGGKAVRLVRKNRILRFEAPIQGFEREWWRCRICRRVMQYLFQPYSFSKPVLTTCHGIGERDYNCDTISEAEAVKVLRETWDRVVIEKKEKTNVPLPEVSLPPEGSS